MDIVQVTWLNGFYRLDDIPTVKVQELNGVGLYAVLIAKFDKQTTKWESWKLLYIGHAFDQTLRDRIPQPHEADKCVKNWFDANPGFEKVVMIGAVTLPKQVTKGLLADIECCLINVNQPPCNIACKDAYSGRDLDIINLGDYKPLQLKSKCSKTKL